MSPLWFLVLFRKTLFSLYLHINLQVMVFMVFGAISWLGFSWEIVLTVGCLLCLWKVPFSSGGRGWWPNMHHVEQSGKSKGSRKEERWSFSFLFFSEGDKKGEGLNFLVWRCFFHFNSLFNTVWERDLIDGWNWLIFSKEREVSDTLKTSGGRSLHW